MRLRFVLDLASGPDTIRALAACLEALTEIDAGQIVAGELPDLYTTGVRYRSEVVPGRRNRARWREDWLDARSLLAARGGDCEDLASYVAAWYRARWGLPARALPVYLRPGLIHCIVLVGGRIEDPSAILGMRVPPGLDYAAPLASTLVALGEHA